MRIAAITSAGACGIAAADLQRLQSKIHPLPSGCWRWRGTITQWGYGLFLLKGRLRTAHRLVYELLVGPITTPTLDHLCRRKWCVNPAHLDPVSVRENTLRGFGPSARNARRKRCRRRGHRLAGTNLRIKRGRYGILRSCRACERELNRRLQAKYRREGRLRRGR